MFEKFQDIFNIDINKIVNILGDANINVLLLGPSGVGKTSSLTSMYYSLADGLIVNNKESDFQLLADDNTENRLHKKLAMLKKAFVSQEDFNSLWNTVVSNGDDVNFANTIQGTMRAESFKFFFAKDFNNKDRITINFKDFPGGFMNNRKEDIREWIKSSQIVIIPIDTPALMESEGVFNEKVNKPSLLLKVFRDIKSTFSDGKTRLIIFLPLKCEKYVQSDDFNNLYKSFENEYSSMIKFFKQPSLEKSCSVVFTPIETLGEIEFNKIEKDDRGEPIFLYKKRDNRAKYRPKNTEQPLLYILTFLINDVIRSSKKFNPFSYFKNKKLEVIRDELFNNCKKDREFKIIHNQELLKS